MTALTRTLATIATMLIANLRVHAQQPVSDDPLTLFSRLMPVLSHERCANCHGATNPYRGEFHPGAVPRTSDCTGCHTASQKWNTAPPAMAFYQKSTRALCQHFALLNPPGSNNVEVHVQTDELIGLAFIGRRGNAVTPEFTQTPPMAKAQFLQALRTWVRDGGAACSAWEGTITREETIYSDHTIGPSNAETRHWQNGTRSLTITIRDGQATVQTLVWGETNLRMVTIQDGCRSAQFSRIQYHLEGTEGQSTQRVMAPDSVLRPAVSAPGTVRVGLKADGSYRIQVTPLYEKISRTESSRLESACIALASPPPSSMTLTHKPVVFEIVGTLPVSGNRRELKGSSVVTMTSSNSDRSVGIEQYGDPSRLDGTDIPFKVKTTWDLKRLP